MKCRTKEENIEVIEKVFNHLSKGGNIKTAAAELNIPPHSLRSILRRYRERNGYKSTIHMLVDYFLPKLKTKT